MKLQTLRHEDRRRVLVEYIKDQPFRTSKVMYVNDENVPLGKHYHKLKDDIFFLVKGFGKYEIDGKREIMNEGDCIYVKAGQVHAFSLLRGSILIESSTLPYDKGDEYEA